MTLIPFWPWLLMVCIFSVSFIRQLFSSALEIPMLKQIYSFGRATVWWPHYWYTWNSVRFKSVSNRKSCIDQKRVCGELTAFIYGRNLNLVFFRHKGIEPLSGSACSGTSTLMPKTSEFLRVCVHSSVSRSHEWSQTTWNGLSSKAFSNPLSFHGSLMHT